MTLRSDIEFRSGFPDDTVGDDDGIVVWPDMTLFRMFLTDLQGILGADGRFGVIGWFPRGRGAHDGTGGRAV